MKVTSTILPDNEPFYKLENGVVFYSNHVYYMKMLLIGTGDDMTFNAVSLSSGIPCYFGPKHYVTPIDGEFVVKKVKA